MPLMQPMEVTSPQGCRYRKGVKNMVKQIIKEVELTDITINKGKETYCIFAKACVEDVRKPIDLTYDCISGNLVVHQWWRVEKETVDAIRTEFMRFIEMVGRHKGRRLERNGICDIW